MHREDFRRVGVWNSTANQFEQYVIVHPKISHAAQRGSGKYGLPRGVMARLFKNDRV